MEKIALIEEQKNDLDLMRIKKAKKTTPSESSNSSSQAMSFELPRSSYILKVDFNQLNAMNYISLMEDRLAEQEIATASPK